MRREAAICTQILLEACTRYTGMLCTRGEARGIARRGNAQCVWLVTESRVPGQQSAGSKSCSWWPAFMRNKAGTGPEGGIPQIAPAEHARRHSGTERFFLQRNRRSGHPVTSCAFTPSARPPRTTRAVLPGHTVIIPRRGLPDTAHQTKRPLRTPPPPRQTE
jgi:hypothetical protein